MMKENNLARRILRRLWGILPNQLLAKLDNWQFLRHYPTILPTDSLIETWNSSCWEEYQRWINIHSITTFAQWLEQHQHDLSLSNPPKITLVTPVYNTEPKILFDCIISVRMQSYLCWQWILVDDGSSNQDTLQLLKSKSCNDPRIQIIYNEKSQGISAATNKAIAHAAGDYVAFLDHDDRLALNTLSLIAQEIIADPSLDIIYSDRDMLSEEGDRYLHLFKPDWSPETLLSGNYVFHLMCYKLTLLKQLNGLRSAFDGSQDYDLILRAAETRPKVKHIPKILYHWRQHSASVALNVNAKEYAFQAGIRALNTTLTRRGIHGTAKEIPNFWRGTYQLDLTMPNIDQVKIIILPDTDLNNGYAADVASAINQSAEAYIAILRHDIQPETENTLLQLCAWLALDQVGFASGKIINTHKQLDYIGMAYNQDTSLMYPYRGFPMTEPCYMGVSQIARNISAPHPQCVVFRRDIWTALKGFNSALNGPHALLDLALQAHLAGWRSVIVPQCVFMQSGNALLAEHFMDDALVFKAHWAKHLQQGDPYYNINLAQHNPDMGLDI